MESKSEMLAADTTHNKRNSNNSQSAVCVFIGDDKNNEIEYFPRETHTKIKRFSKDI